MQQGTAHIKKVSCTALFTALIIVGHFLAIPIAVSPSPIVLGDMFVLMAGLYLGAKWGTMGVVVYILMGAVGLPVFAGFTGGIGVLLSPRGGFFIGYLFATALCGFITKGKQIKMRTVLCVVIVAYIVLFSCGIIWMRYFMPSWIAAISAGFLPFLPGTVLKILLIMLLQKKLRPHLRLEF
jgi:biotin transport system substrate-specific component